MDQCPQGHNVPAGQRYCGTCGAELTVDPAEPGQPAPGRRSESSSFAGRLLPSGRTPVLLVAGVLVALTLGVVLVPRLFGGQTLAVSIGDTAAGSCEEEYTTSRFVGGELVLYDSSEDIIGKEVIVGSAEVGSGKFEEDGGCYWEVEFSDVDNSDAYVLSITLPGGSDPPGDEVTEEFTYSFDELEEDGWAIDLSVNR